MARLLGAFAFVIWDGRTHTLLCARDHIGFRPFYYYDGPRQFVFATDVKAILAVEGVPRRLDEEALTAHDVRHIHLLKERTFFHDVAKLLPAHLLTVRADSVQRQAHWTPDRQQEIRLPSNDAYTELLRERLEQATDCRLRSVHPIGSHLSGGLDSTSVAVLAARRLRHSGRTLARAYSWSPPPTPEDFPLRDERALIEMVCKDEGVLCTYTTLTPDDVVAYYSRDISLEPTETLQHELVVLQAAASQGVGVILSGWGGDDLITNKGRGYFAELLVRGRWRTLWRESRQSARLNGRNAWKVLLGQALMPLVPDAVFVLTRRDVPGWARRLAAETPATWADLGPQARQMLREQWRCFRVRPGVRRNQLMLLELGYLACRLEAWAHAGAQVGVEHRYPLLDRRLIELSLALPAEMFFQQGWHRFLFRYTMADMLRKEVCWNKDKREPAKWNAQYRVFEAGLRQFLEKPDDGMGTVQGSVPTQAVQFNRLRRHLLTISGPMQPI